jgi:hypothetical protein
LKIVAVLGTSLITNSIFRSGGIPDNYSGMTSRKSETALISTVEVASR